VLFIDGRDIIDWRVDQHVFQSASIGAKQALAEQNQVE
jgi:hypothetical protein